MNKKILGYGLLTVLMLSVTAYSALAAILTAGQSFTVPTGKTAFYVVIDNQYADEITHSEIYWAGMQENITTTPAYISLHAGWLQYIRERIVVGHQLYDEEIFKRTQVSINPVE